MARSNFRKAERAVEVSVGESVRIIRELQGLSQNELSARSSARKSSRKSGFTVVPKFPGGVDEALRRTQSVGG